MIVPNQRLPARNAVPELEGLRPRHVPEVQRLHTRNRKGGKQEGCDEISWPKPPPTVGEDNFRNTGRRRGLRQSLPPGAPSIRIVWTWRSALTKALTEIRFVVLSCVPEGPSFFPACALCGCEG